MKEDGHLIYRERKGGVKTMYWGKGAVGNVERGERGGIISSFHEHTGKTGRCQKSGKKAVNYIE